MEIDFSEAFYKGSSVILDPFLLTILKFYTNQKDKYQCLLLLIIVFIIKPIIGKKRPYIKASSETIQHRFLKDNYSFPSAHTSIATFINPLIGLFSAFSRVELGVHGIEDVVVTFVLVILYRHLIKSYNEKENNIYKLEEPLYYRYPTLEKNNVYKIKYDSLINHFEDYYKVLYTSIKNATNNIYIHSWFIDSTFPINESGETIVDLLVEARDERNVSVKIITSSNKYNVFSDKLKWEQKKGLKDTNYVIKKIIKIATKNQSSLFCYHRKYVIIDNILLLGLSDICPKRSSNYSKPNRYNYLFYEMGLKFTIDKNLVKELLIQESSNNPMPVKCHLEFGEYVNFYYNEQLLPRLLKLINEANNSIYINHQYFFACSQCKTRIADALCNKIIKCFKNKTDLNINIYTNWNHKVDSNKLKIEIMQHYYSISVQYIRKKLLENGIKMSNFIKIYDQSDKSFKKTPIFNHNKIILFDKKICVFGSHNLAERSFGNDVELSIETNSGTIIKDIEGYIKKFNNGYESFQEISNLTNVNNKLQKALFMVTPTIYQT